MASEHDDTPEYLREWAAAVAKATSTAELRLLVRVYRETARQRETPKAEREQSKRRANALKKHL